LFFTCSFFYLFFCIFFSFVSCVFGYKRGYKIFTKEKKDTKSYRIQRRKDTRKRKDTKFFSSDKRTERNPQKTKSPDAAPFCNPCHARPFPSESSTIPLVTVTTVPLGKANGIETRCVKSKSVLTPEKWAKYKDAVEKRELERGS
jgi:hypothetical protein